MLPVAAAIMGHKGILMELQANTVTAIIPHYGITEFLACCSIAYAMSPVRFQGLTAIPSSRHCLVTSTSCLL